jgi:hypothetical protein
MRHGRWCVACGFAADRCRASNPQSLIPCSSPPLVRIFHQRVGWVEQTANLVGLRSLAGRCFPHNPEFKGDAVCEDPPEVARPCPTLP